jgi:uncharacterized protein (TIGR02391 family)
MWTELNPQIVELCRRRFENEFYADCILTALREINTRLKAYVLRKTGNEYDGVDLMRKAFGFNYNRNTGNIDRMPVVLLVENLESETSRNLQDGYMNIFAGSFSAYRNTKAHENMTPTSNRTIHMLYLCSLLMYKLDESSMDE